MSGERRIKAFKVCVKAAYLASVCALALAITALPVSLWIVAAVATIASNTILLAGGGWLFGESSPEVAGPYATRDLGVEPDILADTYGEMRARYPWAVQAGRALADQLRMGLPDLDDVTLGRVVLAVSEELSHGLSCRSCEPYRAIDVLAAALELTALEWQTAGSDGAP